MGILSAIRRLGDCCGTRTAMRMNACDAHTRLSRVDMHPVRCIAPTIGLSVESVFRTFAANRAHPGDAQILKGVSLVTFFAPAKKVTRSAEGRAEALDFAWQQGEQQQTARSRWIPAFAGMTSRQEMTRDSENRSAKSDSHELDSRFRGNDVSV